MHAMPAQGKRLVASGGFDSCHGPRGLSAASAAAAVNSSVATAHATRAATPRGRQLSGGSAGAHGAGSRSPSPKPCVVRFIVPEFFTAPGQVLALVGSSAALGNWEASRAVRLSWQDGHRWVADVQLEPGWNGALEFKVELPAADPFLSGSVLHMQARSIMTH